jgi:hypothetical protein
MPHSIKWRFRTLFFRRFGISILGFSFYLWDSLTQELLLGMNGIEISCGAKLSPMIPSSRDSIGIGVTGSSNPGGNEGRSRLSVIADCGLLLSLGM